MADLLTRVQRELDERLETLRPLVDEARQLEEALAALDGAPATAVAEPEQRASRISAAAPAPQAPVAVDAPASSETDPNATVRTRISREQADERRRQALAIIGANPGTTASNLALLLDTSTGTMHSLLKRLESEGEIVKAEKGFSRPPKEAAA